MAIGLPVGRVVGRRPPTGTAGAPRHEIHPARARPGDDDDDMLAMSNLQQQRKIVEQLRREAGLKRMEVSAAVEDLKKYIQDHESDDYLLVGFHSQKANPFREKSSCSLL
ncbi:hypothetical protein HPB49_000185 [Dermacentor silvarum]|uniref:Uncharacterized protein n=1 Tax=Dermacentor silvarum TaxID=543639 RepID=A0ACB8DH42_DERSI|nr:hypothetical protein HPB49_000185 [Dermacentor silvarum]